MFIFMEFSPPLSDEDAEALESELGSIANELGIEGVDVARWGEDDADLLKSLELYYEDDREGDEQLSRYAEEILSEFERYQSLGGLLEDFRAILKRVGRINLKLVRE